MSKETSVFILGLFLVAIPFLGIPLLWRQYLIVGAGVALVLIGYALRRAVYLKRIEISYGERGIDSFVETTEKLFDEQVLK